MKVMVLGCGPAGLMAAQGANDALAQAGEDIQVMILSKANKSPLYGCQYLHRPIPGVTPRAERFVSYRLVGDPDEYRRKVYGNNFIGTVSPEDLSDEHHAWDIRATYNALWAAWEHGITDVNIDPPTLVRAIDEAQPDIVINSVPRDALCYAGHAFGCTEVWAAGDAPELGIRIPYACPDEMVLCNGTDNPAWYRMSRVFGRTTVEWPGDIRLVPVATAARVRKPTSHDCDCWPTLFHVGRYGRWEKGVLSHDAYFGTINHINEKIGAASAAAEAGQA